MMDRFQSFSMITLALGVIAVMATVCAGPAAAQQPLLDAHEVWTTHNRYTRSILDADTLVLRRRADEFPQVEQARLNPVSPAVRKEFVLTGEHKPPVLAVRCDEQGPTLKLPSAALGIGCYGVRVIAMVASDEIEQYRRPLYVELLIEGPEGVAPQRFRQRVPYWDDFYSVTELYFNVDVPGEYKTAVRVGAGSAVSLHVNRLELHDVLRPLPQTAGKTRGSLWTPAEREFLRGGSDPDKVLQSVQRWTGRLDEYVARAQATPELSDQERADRDAALWHSMPPLNSQFLGWFPLAFPQKELYKTQVVLDDPRHKEAGQWKWTGGRMGWLSPLELVNEKLGLRYGREDFVNYRRLPAPYPWPDDGGGVYLPATGAATHADNHVVLATLLTERWTALVGQLAAWDGDDIHNRLPLLYHALDNRRAARDAALMLCHWAYVYPTFTQAQVIDFALINPASIYNRDMRLAGRYVNDGLDGLQAGLAVSYDHLFDFIHGNDELAQAVGRFIPWVKTEADVRRLIETRVLQFGARQCMLFNLYNNAEHPKMLFRNALIQQHPEITRPWMDFLWTQTWIYPHARSGLPDYLSTTIQRDGSTDIGSIFYSGQGSPLAELALWSRRYVEAGGDPRYDLTDPRQFAKLRHAGRFVIDKTVAGGFPMAIGDVGDPDQPRMFNVNFPSSEMQLRDGYALSGDPRLAWMIAEYFGRGSADDATWQRISRDRDGLGGHPLLRPNPRVMANWAGILETGSDHGDFRFLTAAYLRIGTGHGHTHDDTLDLQMNALGLRMVNDVGWRPSYSTPKATFSQLHNLVEVDEQNWQGHAWVDAFAPGRAVSYLRAQATPPTQLRQVTHRSRAISLIEVSAGRPGSTPPAPLPYTNETRFPQDAVLPQAYVFDVQRTAGGRMHTWCFHGTLSDDFQWNATTAAGLEQGESEYLRRYLQGEKIKFAGAAPSTLVATWRVRREPYELTAVNRDGVALTVAQGGGEANMLGGAFNPAAPRAFTRVHLVDHGAARALVAHPEPNVAAVKHTWPFLFVQRKAEKDLRTVFVSVIEPYRGQPLIKRVVAVPTGDTEPDAQRAVAVLVELADGRRDLCYSDGRAVARTVGDVAVQGQYALVRTGPSGVEQLHLVGGTRLAGPWGELIMPAVERRATVAAVDYLAGQVTLSGSAADLAGHWVGQQVEFGNEQHRTSYTIAAAEAEGSQLRLTLDKPMDLGFSRVVAADPKTRRVTVTVTPNAVNHAGMSAGLRCTSDRGDKAWRCRLAEGVAGTYELEEDFEAGDFPVGGMLRLWELGVGDEARLVNHAGARRLDDGRWEVTSNTEARFAPSR